VSGQSLDLSWTFGNYRYGSKAGLKWKDMNQSGDRDEIFGMPGVLEPVLPGWYIQLWTYDSGTGLPVSFVERVMTDEFGEYAFEGLMPGETYLVCEELQASWTQTFPTLATEPEGEDVALCPAVGDGGFALGPVGYTFTVTSGAEFLNNDFGNNRFEGCTLTQGYWKTHSIYGPAPYDDTWAEIGEDTQFFNNFLDYDSATPADPITWYEIMHMPPSGGNAYIILAYQYVAASLNFEAGADPSAVMTEYGQATALLSTYTWDYDWKVDLDGVRDQFITFATTLDNYNNGLIGPGHCVE
jgi:hypothetical protein